MRLLPAAFLGALSGVLLALAVPGPGLWPLAFVALAPWAYATERASTPRASFIADYLCGVAFYVPTVVWLSRITLVAYVPVVAIAPLFICIAGFVYRGLRRVLHPAIALPCAWLVGEIARSLPPASFPCAWLGYSAAGWLDLAGSASIGGPLLLTFLFAACSGAVAACFSPRSAIGKVLPLLACAVVVAGAALLGRTLRADFGEIRFGPSIACVQPNIEQSLKDGGVDARELGERLLRETEKASALEPEMIVLPETMMPPYVARGLDPNLDLAGGGAPYLVKDAMADEAGFLRLLRRAAGPKPWILSGVFLYGPGLDPNSARPRNGALLYDRNNRDAGRYEKVHLVPGSESLPLFPEGGFGDFIRRALDPFTSGMMLDMAPGPGAVVMELPRDGAPSARFSVTICYDNAFADLYLDAAKQGAAFHVVLSNEGWFPNSFEMDQMLAYSTFRAIESRRSVVRCTNTGISCLVLPNGRVAAALEREGRRSEIDGVLTVSPPMATSTTIYAAVRDIPWWLTAALASAAAVVFRRRTRSGPVSP